MEPVDPAQRITPLLVVPALGASLLILATAWMEPYGIFHDELYYLANSQRLGFGYVDHPPLSAWLLALVTKAFGDGALALLLVPALCAGATVALTGGLAQRLGGGKYAQLLAAASVASAPFFLAFFSFYSVNAIELFLWTLGIFVFAELLRSEDERLWLGFGCVAGLALLNKHTVALLLAAIALATLASPLRDHLRRRGFWWGAGIALLLASPNLIWNLVNDFPSWSFYRSRTGMNLPTGVGDALLLQVIGLNPGTALLWLPGSVWLLFSKRARPLRPLAVVFLALFAAILLTGQRRGDRIAGAYPIALAAGAVVWEQARIPGARIARRVVPAAIAAFGLLLLPASLPVLSPEREIAYFEALGQKPEIEAVDVGQMIPIHLMGQLEWPRFSSEVMAMIDTLSPEERGRSVVLTPHWLYAAVLEYYARDREHPPIVSPHNAYWFWRAEAGERSEVIAIGVPEQLLAETFAILRPLGTFRCEHCAVWRPDLTVVYARNSARPLAELLEDWRHFGIGGVPELMDDPALP